MKKYMCFWGQGYQDVNGNDILEFHDESFFGTDVGYSKETIEEVKYLEVGQTYANHEHGFNSHIITRVI